MLVRAKDISGIQVSHLCQGRKRNYWKIVNNFFINISKKITSTIPRTKKSVELLNIITKKVSFVIAVARENLKV